VKIVIQCAGSKRLDANTLIYDGVIANFVASAKLAPATELGRFVTPDDAVGESSMTWRELLLTSQGMQSGLLTAGELYRPRVYRELLASYGSENVFILSAGWGLVRADFRLPKYDITFSSQAEKYKRRKISDTFMDFNQLPDGPDPVVFFGGKHYRPLLNSLLSSQQRPKIAFFRSERSAKCEILDGWEMRPYITSKLTNWHYDAAATFATGHLQIGDRL